jgi:hypothetical protein
LLMMQMIRDDDLPTSIDIKVSGEHTLSNSSS